MSFKLAGLLGSEKEKARPELLVHVENVYMLVTVHKVSIWSMHSICTLASSCI